MSQPHTFKSGPPLGDAGMATGFGVLPAPPQDPPMINYRGYGLNQPFDLRSRIKLSREKPMIGIFYGAFPHIGLGRAIGQAGYDYVLLDWEHTSFSTETLIEMIKTIQYAGEGNTAVIVRVPSHDHQYIAWVLDAGASGVIVPHISTPEQAEAVVKVSRFPPRGERSIPPNALLWGYNDNAHGGGGMFEVFNRAAVIVQIEDEIGARNADAIASVDGIDCLMLGPGDLAGSLGLTFATMAQDPTFQECCKLVSDAAAKHGLGAMMPSFMPMVKPHLDMGFTLLSVANDGFILTQGLRKNLVTAHEDLKAWQSSHVGEQA
ncbi:hypothetical protein TREMEDRAFT_64402 [Tremella mesenterica DSM 1558]|uniref:uncharacterized protein n=1 Tax=Tremella mesenterica (strain ATCC 24925 / CBS 8224 / DSM 1558 / NBRC 9311 / NRRL Y-6157 / RJB 2259-6 / UBC 559-6) TaxID=578456 RepID=UPI0003F4A1B2|nr:uncharacterized protein TREMEDRAFT_64402 [Tremella mesenterica DSM 1558]EIW67162.1 hypothetical protein TREMEDRAFT_64402 [Tremella mesenterica DSM 1558]